MEKLKRLQLKNELAQNVETFVCKVTKVAKQIKGSGGGSTNLTSIVPKGSWTLKSSASTWKPFNFTQKPIDREANCLGKSSFGP